MFKSLFVGRKLFYQLSGRACSQMTPRSVREERKGSRTFSSRTLSFRTLSSRTSSSPDTQVPGHPGLSDIQLPGHTTPRTFRSFGHSGLSDIQLPGQTAPRTFRSFGHSGLSDVQVLFSGFWTVFGKFSDFWKIFRILDDFHIFGRLSVFRFREDFWENFSFSENF